jgi:diacylglycerol kinase family enzyme
MSMATPYHNVHVIINPASGRDEPILNPINDVFGRYDIPWEAHVTHQSGDATRLTVEALEAGADLIVSYGGDGTITEIVNGMVGKGVPLALLPGGTGNGIAIELKIPDELIPALELIGVSAARRQLDVGRCGDHYIIQRIFVGLPEDFRPSRELKDRIGFLAYPLHVAKFLKERSTIKFRVSVDDQEFEENGILCLINNIGYSNSQRLQDLVERLFLDVQIHKGPGGTIPAEATVLNNISPEDGLLDVLLVGGEQSILQSLSSLVIRSDDNGLAKVHFFQGKRIAISATPAQPVLLDGEAASETPIQVEVLPRAIDVIVPG